MKYTLIFIWLIIFCNPISCQVPHWVWAKTTNTGGAGENNYINNISCDLESNIYISGFCDSCSFGNIIINPYGLRSVNFIVKINSSGNVIWTKSTNLGISSEIIDSMGNLYFTGSMGDTAYLDNDTIIDSYSGGLFIAKLDSSGNKIWVKTINGGVLSNGWELSYSPYLNIDAFNNLYLYGTYTQINFGNIILNDSIDGGEFIAKFDSSGNVLWAKGVGKYTKESLSLTSDNHSNIYVTGIVIPYPYNKFIIGSDTLFSKNGYNFIAKYDSSGNFLWAKNFNAYEGLPQMSSGTDNAGNYYLTGSHFWDSLKFDSTYLNCGLNQMYLLKYDPSGNELWAKTTYQYLNESTIHDTMVQPTALSVDKYNNICITGYYKRTIIGNDTLSTNQSYDIFIVKYDSSGAMKWVTSVGGDSSDYSYCMTIDINGNIYIGGEFVSDSVKFGNTTLYNSHIGLSSNPGLNNIFFAKLSDTNSGIISIKNEEEMIIYPNPTSSIFKILLPEQTKYIRIYNSLGITIVNKPINKQSSQSFTLNQPGIYIVQVETDKAVITKKVVVTN